MRLGCLSELAARGVVRDFLVTEREKSLTRLFRII
jgi:hypothetical protein